MNSKTKLVYEQKLRQFQKLNQIRFTFKKFKMAFVDPSGIPYKAKRCSINEPNKEFVILENLSFFYVGASPHGGGSLLFKGQRNDSEFALFFSFDPGDPDTFFNLTRMRHPDGNPGEGAEVDPLVEKLTLGLNGTIVKLEYEYDEDQEDNSKLPTCTEVVTFFGGLCIVAKNELDTSETSSSSSGGSNSSPSPIIHPTVLMETEN